MYKLLLDDYLYQAPVQEDKNVRIEKSDLYLETSKISDQTTVQGRIYHFAMSTSPLNFMVSNKEIRKQYEMLESLRNNSGNSSIEVSQDEKKKIDKALWVTSSAVRQTKDSEGNIQLIPRMFRMSAFLPINIPIVVGLLLSPPTMALTAFWQWVNQSYMAGLNYQNKNESCTFTNKDLMQGYCSGVGSALIVALSLRRASSGIVKSASGNKLLMLNGLIGSVGAGTASYFNTQAMRRAEAQTGIEAFSSPDLDPNTSLGRSRSCATQAIWETTQSRIFLSVFCTVTPCLFVLGLTRSAKTRALIASNQKAKFSMELFCIITSLWMGLPIAIGMFNPISKYDVSQIKNQEEKDRFRKHDTLYFSKGL